MFQQQPSFESNFVAPSGLTLKKIFMFETGTYNQQWRRPYETTVDGEILRAIEEKTQGYSEFTPMVMAGVANRFIAPKAQPESSIQIPNNWNEPRIRFLMELEYSHGSFGAPVTEIVIGYTDHPGVGLNGSVDMNMEFYINSIMQIRNTVVNSPLGNMISSVVTDNSHVLCNNNWNGIYTPQREQRMRPEDIYSVMSIGNMDTDGVAVYDGRAVNTSMAVKSSRMNNYATNYSSKIFEGYRQASLVHNTHDSNENLYSNAKKLTRDNSISSDPFISRISEAYGMANVNKFTFGILKQIFPYAENVTVAKLLAPTQRQTVHMAGQTCEWGGADGETHMATIISQAVPCIMMDLALTRLVFKSTNRTINCQPQTVFMEANGFVSGDLTRQLEVFRVRLESELLNDVTYNNAIDYAIEMNIDLLGETWLSISINGSPMIDYVTPSFADALMTPIITTNNDVIRNLASDFDALSTMLTGNLPINKNTYMGGAMTYEDGTSII